MASGSDLTRYARKLRCMIDFGESLSKLATDPRIKVGCVVFPVDCSAVLGIGYNGAAAGLDHDSINFKQQPGSGRSGAAHAEANALIKMVPTEKPCILYTTRSPCSYCAPLIVNSGCVIGVIQEKEYENDAYGRTILEEGRIPIVEAQMVRMACVGGPINPDYDRSNYDHAVSMMLWWKSLRPTRPTFDNNGRNPVP